MLDKHAGFKVLHCEPLNLWEEKWNQHMLNLPNDTIIKTDINNTRTNQSHHFRLSET